MTIKQKTKGAILISVIVFVLITIFYFAGIFNFLEYKSYDLRVKTLASNTKTHDDIIVLLINQDSIDWAVRERGWGWPWPRAAYAEILDYMKLGGAKSAAFDVIFSESSIYGSEDDDLFSRSSLNFGKVVQTVMLSSRTGRYEQWPQNLQKPLFNLHGFENVIEEFEKLNRDIQGGQIKALFPIEIIKNSASIIGDITGWPDSDQIFRRANLFTVFDGKAIPGLAAASLINDGNNTNISYNEKKRVIEWGDKIIPVDKNGRSILKFKGSIEKYNPYGVHEILISKEALENGTSDKLGMAFLPPQDFYGKYVFIGFYAPGLFDIAHTPIGSLYPGVGVHVTMLDNILSQDFIRQTPVFINILYVFAVIMLVSFITLFSNRIPVIILSLTVIIAGIISLGFAAYNFNYWLPITAPLFGGLLSFLTAVLFNYAVEGSQKRFIKSAFSQYLSPLVIEQLVANPNLLNLGGETKEISIFFSDIQGFTAISEKFKDDPRKLTELINCYLTMMTDTILDSGGTIDKYIGDAIVAFWNAPLDTEDHAAKAVKVSLECCKILEDMQDFFEKRFGVQLITRIGLNTGIAVVGNMGSSKRFSYTMLGDTVNLAARLESLNKQFGTYLMCSDETFVQANKTGCFAGRKLALAAVAGKKEAVTVWEPMPQEAYAKKQDLIKDFDTARDLFYEAKFQESLPIFEKLQNEDRPSAFYAEQARYFIENPGGWKGYWEAKKK